MITCRTVKRYFYNGKGYATLTHACRAIAKEELKEEILGPVVELTREVPAHLYDAPYMESWRGREKLAWLEDDEAKREIKELYIQRFPFCDYWNTESDLIFNHHEHEQWLVKRAKELAKEWRSNQ